MKKLFLILLTLTIYMGYAQENNFKIQGNFSNIKHLDSVYIIGSKMKDGKPVEIVIASDAIKNGEFTLEGYTKYDTRYNLLAVKSSTSARNYFEMVLDKNTIRGSIYIEKNNSIKYSGELVSFPVYQVQGGQHVSKVYAHHSNPEYLKLVNIYYTGKKNKDKMSDEEIVAWQKEFRPLYDFSSHKIDNYAWYKEDHPRHYILLATKYYYYKDYDKFIEKANYVIEHYPDHPESSRIKEMKAAYIARKNGDIKEDKSRVGTQYMDVISYDVDGNELKLSDVVKNNKLVLLDFWASWCSPCRKEFPHLRIAYKHNKNKGFEIFAVSIDGEKEKWVKAVDKEKTTWINAVNLKAMNSKPVSDYGITGIPYNVLIDSDGNIVGENLRGEALEQLLDKHLK